MHTKKMFIASYLDPAIFFENFFFTICWKEIRNV